MKIDLKELVTPLLSVGVAFLIGGIIMAFLGSDPFNAYWHLFQGAFFGWSSIAQTLLMSTPLIFTGLTVAIAFKAGLFNIGGQGQIMIGGLAAASVAAFIENPLINNLVTVLFIAAFAGFLWGGLAGWLKAKFGVHEVISTIMLNFIAISIKQYLINYPLKDGGFAGPSPQTPQVFDWVRLPLLLPDSKVPLNFGLILALLVCIVIYYLFKKTILGYEIRAVGFNPLSSENAGIHVRGKIFLAMGIAGAVAGLGGAERVLGGIADYRFQEGIMAEYGFDGIAVALLGKNHPAGIVLAAILFGMLRSGGMDMQMFAGVPSQLSFILQAIIILFIAGENIFKNWGSWIKKKRNSEEQHVGN